VSLPAAEVRGATESAILVPVSEAEPAVGRLRAVLDQSAARGVPAHVTVLYPFVPPASITAAVIDAAAAAVATVPAFDCTFGVTAWFGEDVLWLSPDPAERFRALTDAVHSAFPAYPPFRGEFVEVIPHLTVGARPPGGVGALRAAEAEVLPMLPVRSHVSHAWLMAGSTSPDSWKLLARLPLGAVTETARTDGPGAY